jgi:uncharacterized protein YeeX (DUF496 family)
MDFRYIKTDGSNILEPNSEASDYIGTNQKEVNILENSKEYIKNKLGKSQANNN